MIRGVHLPARFFYAAGCLILLMVMAYPLPFLLPVAQAGTLLFLFICSVDALVVYGKTVKVIVERSTPAVFSLGDENQVGLSVSNKSGLRLWMEVVDELPEQFQSRDFRIGLTLQGRQSAERTYTLRPLSRGEYWFGHVHVYLTTRLGLVRRKMTQPLERMVPVYSSIIQMRKYELKTFARVANEYGVKKVRRIGHSYEFEHIKQYIRGDDYRSINWKATGRRAQLMVNQYEDERSQQVYCLIDKSRVMHMPFHGLSLFDYAVNAALVISNIVLGKQDKVGLVTFAESPKSIVKADRSRLQLKKILEALYREREGSVEANYESMYLSVRKLVTGRSLMFLYTNFESSYALQRALPQLRKLNDQHLLVVVFFENTEITANTSAHVETVEDIYRQVTAEHFALTKIQLAQQLRQVGIITMLTKPENLTVASINKYLELKSRGMI